MSKYIVGQTAKGSVMVMERQFLGDVEVYVEHLPADTSAKAAAVAGALNAVVEAEARAEMEVDAPRVEFKPLYGGCDLDDIEVDIPATVQKIHDDGNPGLAFALAEANGYDFKPEQSEEVSDAEGAGE